MARFKSNYPDGIRKAGNTMPSKETRTEVYSGAKDNPVFKKEIQFGCNYGREHQAHVRNEHKKY